MDEIIMLYGMYCGRCGQPAHHMAMTPRRVFHVDRRLRPCALPAPPDAQDAAADRRAGRSTRRAA